MYAGLNQFPFAVFIDESKLTRLSKGYDCLEDFSEDIEIVLRENEWMFEKDKPIRTMFEGTKSDLRIVVGVLSEEYFVGGSLYAKIFEQGSEELERLRKSFKNINPAYIFFKPDPDFIFPHGKN